MTRLFGHENIKQQLSSAITGGRIGHAYIFEGIDGIGKTTAALWFARSAICSENKGIPCGRCTNCVKAEVGTHPDIILADDDFVANPKIKSASVDAMRLVKKNIYARPFMAERKFYIIPDAERLLAGAQNSLLKVFEEPPEYCTIILICENAETLMQTIRSRAVTIRFNPLSDSEMKTYISTKHGVDSSKIIKLCAGVPKMADAIISDEDYLKRIDALTAAFSDYLKSNGDLTGILPLITKDNAEFCISYLESYVNEKIETDGLSDNTSAFLNIFDILQNTRRRLKINCNFNLTVTDMLIKSWEAIHG